MSSLLSVKKDLFISYAWSNTSQLVQSIAKKLESNYDFKVWIDQNEMVSGKTLHENIQNGINNSELMLAFVTRAYCESHNCQLEIQYGNRIKKKILYIILERLGDVSRLPNVMGVLLAENICFNAYGDEWNAQNIHNEWTERSLDRLVQAIKDANIKKPL